MSLLAAVVITFVAITVRLLAAAVPANAWLSHSGGLLTALVVLSWTWVFILRALEIVTDRMTVASARMDAIDKILEEIVDRLDQIERRLDVRDYEAAKDRSVSQMRRP